MAVRFPAALTRLALEVEGWIELGSPQYALSKATPLLAASATRTAGLYLCTRALIELGRYQEALSNLAELQPFEQDPEWLAVSEAWCHKRVGRIDLAAQCMERWIARSQHSAIGHYNYGCYLAMLGQKERAIDEVTIACGIDGDFRKQLATESDLDSLRGNRRFEDLARPA